MSAEKTTSKKMTRREMLKMSAFAGAGAIIGASGLGAVTALSDHLMPSSKKAAASGENDHRVPFYGDHQSGIVTPQQTSAYLAAFTITATKKEEIIALFKDWTHLAEMLSKGEVKQEDHANDFIPPSDTGESAGLGASNLTITFGIGPTFFMKNGVDRFGLAAKKPKYLLEIPAMRGDSLQEPFIGGDLCIQACADDQQVAFHAIRNMIKAASGTADILWLQSGFINGAKGETPRNLFGFKDGTANVSHKETNRLKQIVWADEGEPAWMKGGSYMAYRKIMMMIEIWDRTSLKSQEDTFGRKKDSGAGYGKVKEHDAVDTTQMPIGAHTRVARETGREIYRRAYSYTDGIDTLTGNMNSGLMFISFQKNPAKQFVPMLKKLAETDALNEYIKHVGSAMFACPRGVRKGEYLAQDLFK
ncbi:iron uptake transporter deferrochelatase/peroxidase subunit [Bacillus testis]|uniref:iron uptake transporter deferrochelatase/peroxidase subunit n=1 Tax=Bacillus testis TaxID=1622072 RepID=UPI00067F308E|nr:iron uptake transporter deferrochelatase/peroxidase subunit [Bacillus testis]